MKADLFIQALLEAVEVGDDGIWFEPESDPIHYKNVNRSSHAFLIFHPVHGKIGHLQGIHNKTNNEFHINVVSLVGHPSYVRVLDRKGKWNIWHGSRNQSYEGTSRTLVMSGVRQLMKHFPGLTNISGEKRWGTGLRKRARPEREANVRIPKNMRK
jgi:hypothetical protein